MAGPPGDALSRMPSETNPESGTTSYTYDTDSTCGTSNGDLVKRVDAVGNTTCYGYDALHRLTGIRYTSGSYASGTPTKCYVYDSATVNGQTMANAKGRLAEAYTTSSASCPGTSKLTDLGFSYSARGEVTDFYESTPHSGGYYHSTASYWANGVLSALNPLNNTSVLPAITYGVDGEGRPNSAGASSGTNPVLSTSYNVASQATGVTLGTYDSDAFTFDGNTGRMTQYKFAVGSTPSTVTGNLTWNANGTIASLAITDQFNSANTQNCTYSYDDLARVSGANCGSVWAQTFGFDPFGNLTKSGSVSFQPTYNTSTNRMASLPGFTPTYDANGNTTADSLHTYTWDAEGLSLTVDSNGLTYDAFGRMVEQNRGGTYTQILYAGATKLALMNGQTVTKAFIPLPAGATAVYVSGGTLSYFRHPDWLGSSRFASTTSRTMYYSGAYAPFGEAYAEAGTADRSFTGQNQDTIPGSTTGLYDFLFRQYAQYGRWISPDPAGLGAVDPTNPQTWNRYAYVTNNPLSSVDRLGLCEWPDCPMIQETNGGGGGYWFGGGGGYWFFGPGGPPSPPSDPMSQPSDWDRGCDFLKAKFNVTNCNFQLPFVGNPGGAGNHAANNCTPGTKGCFNVPTQQQLAQQQLQECNSSFRNTTLGKVVRFGSVLSFADNFVSAAINWGETIATKGAYYGIMEFAGQSANVPVQQIFVKPAAEVTAVKTVAKPFIGAVGTAGIVMATTMDYGAQVNCQVQVYGIVDPDWTD